MIAPVLGSMVTRVWSTLANMLVIMLAGHKLGAEGLGAISLIVLAITMVQVANNVVGGPALVYLAPRAPAAALLRPAYAWALVVAMGVWWPVHHLSMVPEGTATHVVVLALMQSLYNIHLNMLLGRQHLLLFNLITAIHALLLLVVFSIAVLGEGEAGLMGYIIASHVAFGGTLLLSTVALFLGGRKAHMPAEPQVLVRMVRQGLRIQSGNLMQLFNYRLAYYLIERYAGISALGVYSVATQLSEGAWLAPKSMAMVLYSTVSNTPDQERQQKLTLTMLKASFAFALPVVVVLLLVPDLLFSLLFGREISGLRPILALLSPGIMAVALTQSFSHYFSGIGRHGLNAITSGIGLLVTLGLGFWLVPKLGMIGGAITASVAYSISTLHQLIVYRKLTGTAWRDLLPDAEDGARIKRLWRRLLGRA